MAGGSPLDLNGRLEGAEGRDRWGNYRRDCCGRSRGEEGGSWRKGEDPTCGARVAVREREGKERAVAVAGAEGRAADGLVGLLGPKGRERWGVWVFFFFKTFSFKTLSKHKLFSNFKHFKPFQNFQIILEKTFKTSHHHT
jgi:hypothetical protein